MGLLRRKEVKYMTIKTKVKATILPAIAGVAVLAGLVTAVSAQSVNPQDTLNALTEQMRTKAEQAVNAGQTTKGPHEGEVAFTGETAKQLEELRRQGSNAKEATLARPAPERGAAVAKIRAFTGNQGLNPNYVSTAKSSYSNTAIAEYYSVGQDYFEVNTATNEIVQFGPAPVAKGQPAKEYNTEAKFTPEQIEAKAREFIAKNAPDANLSNLKASTGEKGGTNFFFRFTDESRKVEDVQPFVQVGFTVGGDLLSYTNTLGL